MKRNIIIGLCTLITLQTSGQIELPKFFGSNMVLQRDEPIRIWGKSNPGETISVTFYKEIKRTTVAVDSTWQVEFAEKSACFEPHTISISSENDRVLLKNVLVGDVWLLSGQSNMEWPLGSEMHFDEEKNEFPNEELRFFNTHYVGKGIYGEKYSRKELDQLSTQQFYTGNWEVGGLPQVKEVSAVGYYFGKAIAQKVDVPVGLINLAIGGAPIETFVSIEALQSDPEFRKKIKGNWLNNDTLPEWVRERGKQNVGGVSEHSDNLGPNHAYKPGFAYTSGIPFLSKFGIKGILWYQGESNAQERERLEEYPQLQSLLVRDYRKQWKKPELPFYWVQLSSIDTANYRSQFWPEFRDMQRLLLNNISHGGMAVTSDIGARNDVHPRNKKDVGYRLARWALADIYGVPILKSGPLPVSAKYLDDKVVISFKYVGNGLKTGDETDLEGFSLDGKTPVPAEIIGSTVVIRVCKKPEYIFYGWQPYSLGNLVNNENLPASTFRIEVEEY